MKTFEEKLNEINTIVNQFRFISDRKTNLEKLGYFVSERPVKSGGVGSVFNLKKETRIQIGYAHAGKNCAYAMCVILTNN